MTGMQFLARIIRVAFFSRLWKNSSRFIAKLLAYGLVFQIAAVHAVSHPVDPNTALVTTPHHHQVHTPVTKQKKPVRRGTPTHNTRPRNSNPSPLTASAHQPTPIPISALPYVGPVAAPLFDWAQTGTLSNVSLSSQQLGFSGPLSGGASYSNVTGIFFNAKYILPLSEQFALGLLGEYGPAQYRVNGTVGYGFSPLSQVKLSGERLSQRLPFQFDSGDIKQRVHQDAVGARFQQLFEQPFFQGVNIGGYYAKAANENLAPVLFESNGLTYTNFRNIAGAKSGGIDAGTELLVTPSTLLSGNLYFDRVRYDTQLTGDTSKNSDGLGGSLNLKQLLGGRLKLWGEASVRKIYDSYQGGLSWLPVPKELGIELTVMGQRVAFHNSLPNNSSVSLQIKWLPDGSKNYDERFHWKNKHLPAIGQWVQTPAVYMQQVLAVAEQITRLLGPTIININPNNGPAAGNNTVIITGSNFVSGLMVFFGGQVATMVTWLSPTLIEVEVPATVPLSVPQEVDVVVQNPDGQQVTLQNGYTYNSEPPPFITSIMPIQGPVVGGTMVTITGTNFLDSVGTTTVSFGGIPATITSITSTQIIVKTPPSTSGPGPVDVMVTTTDGGSDTAPSAFTYIAVPTIDALAPTAGPTAGGNAITIIGTGFTPTSTVSFGGTPAAVTFVSDTEITVLAPPHVTGPVGVTVTTPNGGTSAPTQYNYADPPFILSLSPSSGPLAAGTSVTITGSDFTGTTAVKFGGNQADITGTPTDTQITVLAPGALNPGPVDVTVIAIGGTGIFGNGYTYVAAPVITNISPSSGPTGVGPLMTITGTNFTGATVVNFGSSTAIPTVISDTEITVTPPPHAAETVDLTVTTLNGGTSASTPYIYLDPPTITTIDPTEGSLAGGTLVTIDGTNFTATGTTVTFNSSLPVMATFVSSSRITVVTPAGVTAGPVDVIVTTPGGMSAPSATQYTYIDQSAIGSISPSSGPLAGGTPVTITGKGFMLPGPAATDVTFNGMSGTSFIVVNDTEITVTTPSGGTAGLATVVVQKASGDITSSDTYTYVAAPTITSLSHSSGPLHAYPITINGTNLTGATDVTFGSNLASIVSINSTGTQMQIQTPAGSPGTVDVIVTTANGTGTLLNGYTYVAAPTITNLSPNSGPLAEGNTVTINGSNFTATGTTVYFGNSNPAVTFVTSNQITVAAPSGSAGSMKNVSVVTAGGNSAIFKYTYVAAPTITALSPNEGSTNGGTTVTIIGNNFTPTTTTAKFGSTAATVTFINNTEIKATAPAGSAGVVDVVVTTLGGDSAVSAASKYTYIAPPTISNITPDGGIPGGGTKVTITGTNFYSPATVDFGGNSGTNPDVVDSTTITVLTPTGAGSVNVVVGTPSGNSSPLVGGYTYVVVGQPFGGGVVGCLSDSNNLNNLIAASTDVVGDQKWSSINSTTNATSDTDGMSNTTLITNALGSNAPGAEVCHNYTGGGFTDWFLPSKNQLACLYENRGAIGGFTSFLYWSSTESNPTNAIALSFADGSTSSQGKRFVLIVRCVRALS